MFHTEYVKSLNCNYERVLLGEKPEERRYQYCIINRGGIRGLLPCSLRYVNGDAFLYFDITSKQSISQLYQKKKIDRGWVKDFVWNIKRVHQELNRFLLSNNNLIWFPNQVFQELGNNTLSFIYIPYYSGDNGFMRMLEFMVEHLDYGDNPLVECVYKMYEQYENCGEVYLQEKIFEDVETYFSEEPAAETYAEASMETKNVEQVLHLEEASAVMEDGLMQSKEGSFSETHGAEKSRDRSRRSRKGLLAFLDSSKKKSKELREQYEEMNRLAMAGMAVAEDTIYETETVAEAECEEEEGRTIYYENIAEQKDITKRLYDERGKVLYVLGDEEIIIGKKQGEATLVLNDDTVSRMHARIFKGEEGEYVLEDLNSTNGSFKNGLRLQPYEKRTLFSEDKIRLGNVTITYR